MCLKIVLLRAWLQAACSIMPQQDEASSVPGPLTRTPSFDHWQHWLLPGKQATAYALVQEDGRETLAAQANASACMLRRGARALTGGPMPYATLMYVWCNTRAPGSVIIHSRTERIRQLVVESGPAHLNQWLDYECDIRAEYRQVFGEEPGALIGIAVMTDSDNTHTLARA